MGKVWTSVLVSEMLVLSSAEIQKNVCCALGYNAGAILPKHTGFLTDFDLRDHVKKNPCHFLVQLLSPATPKIGSLRGILRGSPKASITPKSAFTKMAITPSRMVLGPHMGYHWIADMKGYYMRHIYSKSIYVCGSQSPKYQPSPHIAKHPQASYLSLKLV